jgi:aminopeptidase S
MADPALSHAPAPPPGSPTATPIPELTSEALRIAVDVASIRAHLEQLQRIADEHGGNRAAGTPGYDAAVEYVAGRLEAAGYRVERLPFRFDGQSSVNVVAELAGSDGAEVIMLGAHLDSVPAGPGINDNGSGVATLIALAERLAGLERPDRTIRFAFWGAEEIGKHGSRAYVDAMPAAQRDELAAYLNFDMIGSPNYIRLVYDEPGAAPGSEAITATFGAYFDSIGLAWEPIDLTGKADHAAFADAGVATGGLFSGGIELKTAAQAAAFGGVPGVPADACSHRLCDTLANVSHEALDQMSDAIAHAIVTLAGD